MNLKRRKRIIKNRFRSFFYADFPFLTDRSTVSYLKKNKVVFILRGLPGSGKSFIAYKILRCYSQSCACSADVYFSQDGTYCFDSEKLADAHQYCKNTFYKALVIGKKHIVVDNTNIQRWEMDFYIKTANENNYFVIIIEPKTPWKFDIEMLQKNNQHGCSIEYIENRKGQYDTIKPYYWGFFANELISFNLIKLAEKHFNQCLELFEEFENNLPSCNENPVYKSLYHINYKKILHCTTYFEGSYKDEISVKDSYATSPDVINSIGKHFKLMICGFIFTPRTSGVVIKLNKKCLKIWNSEDAFIYKSNEEDKLIPSSCDEDSPKQMEIYERMSGKPMSHSIFSESVDDKALNNTAGLLDQESSKEKIQMKKGERAHFTIGCVEHVEPVQTGFDVLSLKYKRFNYSNIFYWNDCSYMYYGNGECEVLLDWPMHIDCLFTGYYV